MSQSVPCKSCGVALVRKAFFARFAQGDEEVRSWFFCDGCRTWTIEFLDDRFMGDTTTTTVSGPYPEGHCEAELALALTCPDPGNKWCDCPAHQKLGC